MDTPVESPVPAFPLRMAAAAAGVITLFSICYAVAGLAEAGDPIALPGIATGQAVDGLLWLSAAPLAFRTVCRWPIVGSHRARNLIPQISAAAALALACVTLFYTIGEFGRVAGLPFTDDNAVDFGGELLRVVLLFCLIHLLHRRSVRATPTACVGPSSDLLTFRDGTHHHVQPVADIVWADAQGNYVRLHTASGRKLVRSTMQALELRLGSAFLRTHRGVIVNRRALRRVDRLAGGRAAIVLTDGTTLPVGRAYAKRLRDSLDGDRSSPV